MVVDRKKQYARQNAWNRKNRKRLSIVMTPEKAERVKQAAKRYDLSVNALINNAIDYYLQSDLLSSDRSRSDPDPDPEIEDNNNGIIYR